MSRDTSPHPHDTEILDLVNSSDEVIGQIPRSSFPHRAPHGAYIRVVDCFLRNSSGELWIPRRSHTKKLAPGALDYSMGEHVTTGESYEDAALRGFTEELNLTITPSDLTLLTKIPPTPTKPFFQALYLHTTDTTPHYNEADFIEAHWLTPQALHTLITSGTPTKPSLPSTLTHYLSLAHP
ncbi:NUDIX domain-containing protein [Actinocorallia sp. A-T 12471]|uniref:NUDIX domain-containing protein n=1 Tax=Actinocorallia sp. A-T 12471 TaxID=3089813 RepID=UPI0029D146D5|nr:NUDIX domain-containing protein [Actinocorallia sp. A-T 12471]MDX6739189.1 NUDIX domain-containing protein [Actinocorallia sp. A-T 12471]